MKDESYRYLRQLYDGYRNSLERKKKLRSGSALLSSLSIKNNERFRALNEASMSLNNIPAERLLELKESGLIRNTDDVSTYTISAKGVWEIERADGVLNEADLLDFIDNNYFDLFEAGKPLTEKEKVIIFGLLAARAFSAASCVDMRKDTPVKNAWKDVMVSSFSMLREMGVIKKLTMDDLMPENGIEHPASHLIRHTDQLPRKTRAIFKASGKNKYYLDVEDGDNVSLERIAYLFWLVFGESANPENIDDINDYCTKIAYNASIRVFDMAEHKFSSPRYDELMRDGLVESILSRARWEKEA
jgi:hypothetical protein